MPKLTPEHAKKFLTNVAPEKSFWVNNGPVIHSLSELADMAGKLDNKKFAHHVNNGKNDFEKWVHDVIGDAALANQLKAVKTKATFAKVVQQRVQELRSAAG